LSKLDQTCWEWLFGFSECIYDRCSSMYIHGDNSSCVFLYVTISLLIKFYSIIIDTMLHHVVVTRIMIIWGYMLYMLTVSLGDHSIQYNIIVCFVSFCFFFYEQRFLFSGWLCNSTIFFNIASQIWKTRYIKTVCDGFDKKEGKITWSKSHFDLITKLFWVIKYDFLL